MATSFLVVLSRQIGPRHYELGGAPLNSFLTAETQVEDEALLSGRAGKFLADLRTVVRDGVGRHEATSIRPLRANPVDVERLEEVRRRFITAGAGDLTGDPRDYLTARFAERNLASAWDPHTHLAGRFLETQTRFPMTWWHDDPQPGIEEMVELGSALRLAGALPAAAFLAEAERDLNESADETAPRDRLCAALVAATKQLLAASGEIRRLQRILDPIHGDGDPLWILVTPELYQSLLRERLLTDWPGRAAAPAEAAYRRPPDRGEIDLDDFPSGDEPF